MIAAAESAASALSDSAFSWASPMVVAAFSLLMLVLLTALCTERKQSPDELYGQQQVGMERNPSYSGIALAHGNRLSTSAIAETIDEDDLADQEMRRQTVSLAAKPDTAVLAATANSKRMQLGAGDTPWLHHTTRRPEAEALLRQAAASGQDGVFIVRSKREEHGVYALDVAWQENGSVVVNHHAVTRNAAGVFVLDDMIFDRLMSLEEFIAYLMKPKNKAFARHLQLGLPAPKSDAPDTKIQIQSAA